METAPVTDSAGAQAANPFEDIGRDDFLQLLIMQLQNQDPFSPMQSHEMVAELAQFSALEQMTDVNRNLQIMQLLQASINNSQAVSMIGKWIRVPSDTVELMDGDSTEILYEIDSDAGSVSAQIKNEDGDVVRTVELGPQDEGQRNFKWDGLDDDGDQMPDGNYTVSITATPQDPEASDPAVSTFVKAKVDGVHFRDGIVYLLAGGLEFALGDVVEIYGEGDSEDSEDESGDDGGSTGNGGVTPFGDGGPGFFDPLIGR